MAFLEIDDEPGSIAAAFEIPVWFNVDTPVSIATRNTLEDVQLVQVLLHMIYFKSIGPFSKPSQARPNELLDDDNLKMDGICGPITSRWIKAFQIDRNSRGRFASEHFDLLATDGRVDPASGVISRTSGHFFTISALNIVCKDRDPIGFKGLLEEGVEATARRLTFESNLRQLN